MNADIKMMKSLVTVCDVCATAWNVIPAKAGIQVDAGLDSRLRGNDDILVIHQRTLSMGAHA